MIGGVFSIEEFSTFNGPGIRTTVFLKGCPLNCVWCHNPEGRSMENHIMKNPNGCLDCRACLDIGEKFTGKRELVKESIHVCPQNLIRESTKYYTSEELCAILLKNSNIFNKNGGGITFSGGEPLFQYDFLKECLLRIGDQTGRALQTSGMCSEEKFCEILDNIDYVLYDIKIISEKEHIKYTGSSNEKILKNFRKLCSGSVPFCIRTPLIPSVTDTPENIRSIARLLFTHGINYIELLPYNKLSGSKYKMLGQKYAPSFDEEQTVDAHKEIFESFGITANIL